MVKPFARAGERPPRAYQPTTMGFIWGLFKAIALTCAVIIAALVVIDGTLLANLLGKNKE